MKKTLILMAAASAFVLTGCTESDLSGDTSLAKESAPSAIQFSAKTGNTGMTRAGYEGDLTNTSIKNATAGFGVFAYYSGKDPLTTWGSWNGTASTPVAINKAPNFMYNEKLTWIGPSGTPANVWNYSPVKYWPNGKDTANPDDTPSNTATEANAQYLSFFAYAPYVKEGVDYVVGNNFVGGNLPSGVTNAVFTYDAEPTAVQNGIVAMSKNNDAKDMHVKYILNPADATKFVDLTWGVRGKLTYNETDNGVNSVSTLGDVYNTDLTKQPVDEKVTFLFKHALSRVGGSTSSTTSGSKNQICGLWAVVDVDKNSDDPGVGQSAQTTYFSTDFSESKTLVTIESVKIRDAYTYTVTEDTGEKIANTESDFLTDGWFDIMNGKWYGTAKEKTHTTSGNGVTYSVTADNDPGTGEYALNTEIKENATGLNNPTGDDWSTSNSGGATGVTLAKKKVYADNQDVPGLLLIPGESGDNTLYITVKYHVRTADSKLNGGFTYVTQEITNKVTLANNILKPNKYYNLVMHLGLTSVKFEAVVADWSNGNDKYEEDGGETNPAAGENNTSVWLPSNVIYSTQATVEAGTTKTLNIGANNTSYTINLIGATSGHTFTAGITGDGSPSITPASDSFSSTTQAFTVSVPANTGAARDFVVTIKDTAAEPNVVTTVTIHQAAGTVTP